MCCYDQLKAFCSLILLAARFEQQEASAPVAMEGASKEHEMRSLIRKMRTLLAVFLCISEEKDDVDSYRKLYGSCCAVSYFALFFGPCNIRSLLSNTKII
jgi:hypothetical protein